MSRGPPEAEIFLLQKLLVFAFHLTLLACQNSSARRKKLGGLGGCSPQSREKLFFFRAIEHFFGQRPKNEDNILKIINEKYSIGYSKIKCPKSDHFGMRHSFFGRCPIFFRQNRSSPSKKWPVRLCSSGGIFDS